MNDDYFWMLVCENGHVASAHISDEADARGHGKSCETCGAPLHFKCPNCGAPLKGSMKSVLSAGPKSPAAHCYNCSAPIPWRAKASVERTGDLKAVTAAAPHARPDAAPARNKVFIVHGHDELLKAEVARLVERQGLEAIILHERPNEGRTIIEKFEDEAQVAFAVVLMTPDDEIRRPPPPMKVPETRRGAFDELKRQAAAKETVAWRARQNVILELGFFLGKIQRKSVAVLHRPRDGFEFPSDYSGVVYIPVDSGGAWKLALAKEMQAAGLKIDLGKLP